MRLDIHDLGNIGNALSYRIDTLQRYNDECRKIEPKENAYIKCNNDLIRQYEMTLSKIDKRMAEIHSKN